MIIILSIFFVTFLSQVSKAGSSSLELSEREFPTYSQAIQAELGGRGGTFRSHVERGEGRYGGG
jgi:hypothetical protein